MDAVTPMFWVYTLGACLGLTLYYLYRASRGTLFALSNPGNSEFQETQKIIKQIRDTIQSQILNNHVELLAAISKQKIVLHNQDRRDVAIFLSPAMFKELLKNGLSNSAQVDALYDVMTALQVPVGFLGDLPIYISEKLTRAPVFVVGDISWRF